MSGGNRQESVKDLSSFKIKDQSLSRKCLPEGQRVVVPAGLAVPHQVGILLAQSQQRLSL